MREFMPVVEEYAPVRRNPDQAVPVGCYRFDKRIAQPFILREPRQFHELCSGMLRYHQTNKENDKYDTGKAKVRFRKKTKGLPEISHQLELRNKVT